MSLFLTLQRAGLMLSLLSGLLLGSPATAAANGALADCEKKPSYRKHKEAGLDYFLFGAYFLALSELMTAQAPCPDDYHLLAKIGRSYHLLGQLESASEVYRDYLKQAKDSDPDYRDVMRWVKQLMNGTSLLPRGRASLMPQSVSIQSPLERGDRRLSLGRPQKATAGLFVTIGGIGLATSIGLLAIQGKEDVPGRSCGTGYSRNEPCIPLFPSPYAWPMFGVSVALLGTGSLWLAAQPWSRKNKR